MTLQASTLAQVAAANGEPILGAANKPVDLDDPDTVWYVEEGGLDVFLIEQGDGTPVAGARHMLRAGPGQLVFGFGQTSAPLTSFGKGLPGSRFRRLDLSALQAHETDELDGQVEHWVTAVAAAVSSRIQPWPKATLMLNTTGRWTVPEGGVVSARPGVVVWAGVDPGAVVYLGTEEPPDNSTAPIPITQDTWLTVHTETPLEAFATAELRRQGWLTDALGAFHRLIVQTEYLHQRLLLADAVNAQTALATHRRSDEHHARIGLFGVLSPSRAISEAAGDEVVAALSIVGKHEHIAFATPPRHPTDSDPTVREVLEYSGVRSREVRLTSEDRWWLGDSGAMLAFTRDENRPVALLPSARGRYRAVDPSTGESTPVTSRTATQFSEDAWCFYRPFPDEAEIDTRTLMRFATKGVVADIWRFVLAGIVTNFLLLAPAVTLGALAGAVLPSGDTRLLLQATIGLVAFGFLLLMMRMLQGTATMRVEGRLEARISAGLWDRLLSLPTAFFRQYTAGELAARVTVFQVLRDQLSGLVANAVLSFIFFVPMLILLFLYDTGLAWLALGMAAGTIVVAAVHGILQIAPHRRRYAAVRKITGDLFQFISGMSKLRSTGAEASAYALWARSYSEQHRATLQIARLSAHLSAVLAAAPAVFMAVLFVAAWSRDEGQLAVSDFLVVFAVSMVFYASAATLGRSFEALAAIFPAYEQVRPLLTAKPERRAGGTARVELAGELLLDHVSFSYSEDGPRVLDDVSIHARPGEFIAVVGESGSGKSTLLRLALGLENPTGGSVYYDGRDLANLDKNSVRRQVGVVMQDGALQPGNLLENIVGLNPEVSIDDAWHAASLAAVDEDIRAMPMQMFTIVGNGSETFSGGQTQRIRIAASLVRDPRILFLDEATSWLDARSQAKVMEGIESLAATRIAIAHRLSTIQQADRIYVLHQGRVAQQGTFSELYESEGMFRDLVQRQMT